MLGRQIEVKKSFTYTAGDVVTLIFDADKNTISFFVNGKVKGEKDTLSHVWNSFPSIVGPDLPLDEGIKGNEMFPLVLLCADARVSITNVPQSGKCKLNIAIVHTSRAICHRLKF